jgi:glycosyltransferase 2 family protein
MRIVQIIVGLACTFFFLALTFYHVPKDAVAASLANADPIWIGAAMLVYGADLALRVWRWKIILRPLAEVPYPAMARALLVGYGLNAILPARLGELFRAEFLKTSFGLDRVRALTSIVIERLFDGLMVVACLSIGLLLGAATRQNAGILIDVLATGSAIFGLMLIAALCLAGPLMSRAFARFPRLSAQTAMVQRGFEVLHSWRTLEVAALTLLLYLPDALSLWFVVKAVGLGLGVADTLVLLGVVSLSTIVPSGPAFIGTLQFAYALAIEFAGAPRAIGVAAATLAQLCILIPIALAAVAVLVHGSGSALFAGLPGGNPNSRRPARDAGRA